MNQPLVYISLLNWGDAADCINCIYSLKQLNYTNYKLLIRDNASPNNSYKQLKDAFPEFSIMQSEANLGYAAGHWENYKIAKENGAELLWILNSDLEVHPNALDELITAYKEYGDHIYGSVSLQPQNKDIIDFGGAANKNRFKEPFIYNEWKDKEYKYLLAKYPDNYEVQVVEGSSMLLPINLVEKEGFMKLDFFMYAEESDYCYSLGKKGVRSIVATKSIIYHKNAGSVKSHKNLSVIPAYYRRRNSLRFQKEHFDFSRWGCLRYKNGVAANLKTILRGVLLNKKDLNYFYALACLHAFLDKKGKTVHPENFIK